MQIRRILCPVDYSEFSRRALHHAAAIAEWYAAELHVVHACMEVTPASVPLLATVPYEADPREHATAALHDFIVGSDVIRPTAELLSDGDAVPVIVDTARDLDADLIVMGTHGHTGFVRALLGSTTERVLHTAPCPVLTIPRGADEPGSAERVRFTRVLCAIDFSAGSLRAFEAGLSLAGENQAGVTLLHVLGVLSGEDAQSFGNYRIAEYVETRTGELQRQLAGLVSAEARTWCEVSELVELGVPARGILTVAERTNADLIVMGAQGRNGLGLALFGSTTQTVVRRAACPVLTVRG